MRISIFQLFTIPFSPKMQEIHRTLDRSRQSRKSPHRFQKTARYVQEKKNLPDGPTVWKPIPTLKIQSQKGTISLCDSTMGRIFGVLSDWKSTVKNDLGSS
jgi:hypothetical protein